MWKYNRAHLKISRATKTIYKIQRSHNLKITHYSILNLKKISLILHFHTQFYTLVGLCRGVFGSPPFSSHLSTAYCTNPGSIGLLAAVSGDELSWWCSSNVGIGNKNELVVTFLIGAKFTGLFACARYRLHIGECSSVSICNGLRGPCVFIQAGGSGGLIGLMWDSIWPLAIVVGRCNELVVFVPIWWTPFGIDPLVWVWIVCRWAFGVRIRLWGLYGSQSVINSVSIVAGNVVSRWGKLRCFTMSSGRRLKIN